MAVQLTSRDIQTLKEAGFNPDSLKIPSNFFQAHQAAVFLTPANSEFAFSVLLKLVPHPNLLQYREVLDSGTGGKLLVTEPVTKSLALEIRDSIENGSRWEEAERKQLEEGLKAGLVHLEKMGWAKPDLSPDNCYLHTKKNRLQLKIGDLWTCVPLTSLSLAQTNTSLQAVITHISTATAPRPSPTNRETEVLIHVPDPKPPNPPIEQGGWLRQCCCPCFPYLPSRVRPTQSSRV